MLTGAFGQCLRPEKRRKEDLSKLSAGEQEGVPTEVCVCVCFLHLLLAADPQLLGPMVDSWSTEMDGQMDGALVGWTSPNPTWTSKGENQ